MSKSPSESFILELPLQVLIFDEKELNKRFNAGNSIYNACLGECLRRLDLMRESRIWNEARSLCKTAHGKKRKELFSKAKKDHNFSEYSLHSFVKDIRKNCWLEKFIEAQVAQKIATKAFVVCREYLIGKKGRPRFKRKGRFRSIEGKSNGTGLRYKDGYILWGKSLKLKTLFDRKDKYGVEAYAMQCRTKYVRLLRKTIRGKIYWYAQLIKEGKPFQKSKNRVGKGTVGIDIGPSSLAIVSGTDAHLMPFCSGLKPLHHDMKRVEKKMDRSKRKTNPDNFESNGTIKKSVKGWNFSKKYISLKKKLAEKKRIIKETRKRMHGELVNKILEMGSTCKLEKLSYKEFQKNFGKSVGFYAPGLFVSLLRRKAESAGGKVEEFSTYKTKLSQTCICGKTKKKSLSERWHTCTCGKNAQRDLFSAYLSQFVSNDTLDTSQAFLKWAATEPLLERAVSRLEQLAKGKDILSCFGLKQRQSRSRAKGESFVFEALDVVGNCREPKREYQLVSRTPCL